MRRLLIALLVALPLSSEAQEATDPSPGRSDPVRELMDERDKRYEQRFQAQQEAVNAALQSAKEAVASALAAAKEAVTKAEDAANKRFDSVNEFRQQLDDQAKTFMPKAEADIRFQALEDKVNSAITRLDAIKNVDAGATNLWAFIIGAIGILGMIVAIAISLRRQNPQPAQ